ncbi:unnamed protein product [Arctogadus glacialis]
MSLQSYSTLDESSLRLLLDQTLDLDERRLIRSALRELRRREIQDMEAELARKRSRPPRLLQHEDKENQEGPDAVGSLVKLSGRLQGIEDLEELTKLLRSASDYEERKIIRAAIRRLRDEEQQGSERGRAGVHILEAGNLEPQCTLGVVETERETLSEREPIKSQIRDSRGQQTQQGSELHKAESSRTALKRFDVGSSQNIPRSIPYNLVQGSRRGRRRATLGEPEMFWALGTNLVLSFELLRSLRDSLSVL